MSATERIRRIDAHQHYWRPARGDYHWMPAEGPLHRDYLPADLRPLNAAAGIDGTITVQAAQTVAETDWLLQLAGDPASDILGVVGWVPLDTLTHATLDLMAAHPACVGVRPMLQDLEDDDWISTRVPREQLARVAQGELVFEVLSFPRQLPYVVQALESVPELTVVIDHLSKPVYTAERGEWAKWAEHMTALSARPGTYCKLSGMVTEVGAGWSVDDVRRHADFVLEAFGPDRVLFGTDWPVCLQVASHAQVVELAEQLTSPLNDTERAAIFGGNAERVYGI
jgi:L-fuconolactonase